MTIDQVLYRLEEEMQCHLDSPVMGDFMSLTRAWREILTDFSVEMGKQSLTAEEPLHICDSPTQQENRK